MEDGGDAEGSPLNGSHSAPSELTRAPLAARGADGAELGKYSPLQIPSFLVFGELSDH